MLTLYEELKGIALRNLLLFAHGADSCNHLFEMIELRNYVSIIPVGCGKLCCHYALALLTVIEMLPKLLCDKGHERMEQTKKGVEEFHGSVVGDLIHR